MRSAPTTYLVLIPSFATFTPLRDYQCKIRGSKPSRWVIMNRGQGLPTKTSPIIYHFLLRRLRDIWCKLDKGSNLSNCAPRIKSCSFPIRATCRVNLHVSTVKMHLRHKLQLRRSHQKHHLNPMNCTSTYST